MVLAIYKTAWDSIDIPVVHVNDLLIVSFLPTCSAIYDCFTPICKSGHNLTMPITVKWPIIKIDNCVVNIFITHRYNFI